MAYSVESNLEALAVDVVNQGRHARGELLGIWLEVALGVAVLGGPAILQGVWVWRGRVEVPSCMCVWLLSAAVVVVHLGSTIHSPGPSCQS